MTPLPIVDHPAGAGRFHPVHVDTHALIHDLQHAIEGEVRFSAGDRAIYAADGGNYRQVPVGAVIPRSVEDVIAAVRVCHQYKVPILARGGGTSLAGQCCNVAVVIDFTKYLHNILDLDIERRRARVQPGTILDDLRDRAGEHGLTFGPDPSTHNRCVLGGMIGNNSCGVHSVMAGRTADNLEELEILTHDGLRLKVGKTSDAELEQIIRAGGRRGEIYARMKSLRDRYADLIRTRYPHIPRRVSGYNLDELLPEKGFHVARALCGTEGTCVLYLEATVRLMPAHAHRALVVLGYPDIFSAGDHIPDVMEAGPIGLEAIDQKLIGYVHKKHMPQEKYAEMLPSGKGWLLAEFGAATHEEAKAQAEKLVATLRTRPNAPDFRYYPDKEQYDKVWKIRESGLGSTAYIPGQQDTWEGWEDSAVPPDRVGDYLRDLRQLYDKYQYDGALYGHFGQGCIHTRINFGLYTPEGIEKFRSFLNDAADLVVSYGGSLSGEHGDGETRGALLPKMFGPELVQAFREFKSIWDPDGLMNPGKVVDPYPPDANIRVYPDFPDTKVETQFQFPHDKNSFAHATMRCVGVGMCRRTSGGTMCPSYMVTREEKHCTRGRAHLLFEMLKGDEIKDGWRSEDVKDALDLCLACKGCKSDCPVNVDMATLKSEFMYHHYKGKMRPRHAYAMGWIYWWARMASVAPWLANFFSQTPGLRSLTKWIGGIAPQRPMPKFASQTFRHWFQKRGERNQGKAKVIFWPDTFNNFFHPHIAQAGVEVLEAAGFHVVIPKQMLCCGRPLYDFGMLDSAKKLLRQIMHSLHAEIMAGIPIVGLEPSCVATFRDELKELFPEDELAKRLTKQTMLLSEFLQKEAPDWQMPQLSKKAVVHMHCHHKSIMGSEDEKQVLQRLGLDFEILDSGCCGLAGSFGFEPGDPYKVSIACGERVLLPAVRQADKDTLVITDGFSCHTQIVQNTDCQPLHLAQVIRSALPQSNDKAH